ncbi:MAG: HlyD family efflux transporter periplasmic adaptor subunit [Planctomycetia bacterium]|nr:HlyD family efflux transporter periplasmic adaptor subunit [Planctomycetia bacterium]
MSILADSLVSSSARPLAVRVRPDLKVRRHRYQGLASWVVKEPVGLKYFRFREEEYAILSMLDGQVSLDELRRQYEERFPPQKISIEEIWRFIGTLHQNGLVLTHLTGQGPQLRKRHNERRHRELLSAASNILAVRFRGIDPQRLLNWLLPRTRWFFSPLAVCCCLLMGLAAVGLVTVQFQAFRLRLPAFHDFFAARNWIILAATLAVTKVLHEFGHGLACRHFGGECHEMGVMLLVMTPCLYCNVSDSWMLPSKWQRAAIGAAGMYVELVLASIATFVWWLSGPGLVNHVALSVMLICSVSTVVFNGNPLLRYDGYYILSDVLEIPNLWQKATAIVKHKLSAVCLGIEQPEDRYLPQRHQALFALYTVAAVLYRWFVVVGILFFIYNLFKQNGLKPIGELFVGGSVLGMVGQPLWGLKKYFSVPGRREEIKPVRMWLTLGGVVVVLLLALLVPLPHRIYVPFEVQSHDAAQIYVEVPGVLKQIHVTAGQKVQAGAVLADLDNPETRFEEAKLRGQVAELRARLVTLGQQRLRRDATGREADQQMAEAQESLAGAETELSQRQRDLGRLTLRTPRAGTILPPPLHPGEPRGEGGLTGWSGTPLEKRNLGAWLAGAEPFCQVADPRQLEAVLVVDQSDVPFVHAGDEVLLKVDELGGQTLHGRIAEVAQVTVKTSSRQLSTKRGDLDLRPDPTGHDRLVSPSYQARVVLANDEGLLRIGLTGEARIQATSEPLAVRLWRALSRTFLLKL